MFECVAEINFVMAKYGPFLKTLARKNPRQNKPYLAKSAERKAWQYKIQQEKAIGWNA